MTELLAGVTEAFPIITSVVTGIANTIVETPILMLGAVILPVVSFGTGLLIRVFHRA